MATIVVTVPGKLTVFGQYVSLRKVEHKDSVIHISSAGVLVIKDKWRENVRHTYAQGQWLEAQEKK